MKTINVGLIGLTIQNGSHGIKLTGTNLVYHYNHNYDYLKIINNSSWGIHGHQRYQDAFLKNSLIKGNGSGLYFNNHVNFHLHNVIVENNDGDGIYAYQSYPHIYDSIVRNNGSNGIYGNYWNPWTIKTTLVYSNGGDGISVYSNTNTTSTVQNCTVYGNQGQGIAGLVNIENSIIYNNDSSNLEGSVSITYSNIQGGYSGEGNIDADPLFSDPDNGDFSLLSEKESY